MQMLQVVLSEAVHFANTITTQPDAIPHELSLSHYYVLMATSNMLISLLVMGG